MDRVSVEAASTTLLDLDGRKHELKDVWAGRTAVLAFVRHFGCLLCREQVTQLRHEVDKIHAQGAELVVIGNGTRHFARAFQEDVALETPLYIDTTGASYRALGMKRGIARTLGSRRTWVSLWRALRNGVHERRLGVIVRWRRLSVPALVPGTQGDAWQLGGVLVVLPDGSIAYRHESMIAGDHPQASEVLAALKASTR